jgi:hypothetical protein
MRPSCAVAKYGIKAWRFGGSYPRARRDNVGCGFHGQRDRCGADLVRGEATFCGAAELGAVPVDRCSGWPDDLSEVTLMVKPLDGRLWVAHQRVSVQLVPFTQDLIEVGSQRRLPPRFPFCRSSLRGRQIRKGNVRRSNFTSAPSQTNHAELPTPAKAPADPGLDLS